MIDFGDRKVVELIDYKMYVITSGHYDNVYFKGTIIYSEKDDIVGDIKCLFMSIVSYSQVTIKTLSQDSLSYVQITKGVPILSLPSINDSIKNHIVIKGDIQRFKYLYNKNKTLTVELFWKQGDKELSKIFTVSLITGNEIKVKDIFKSEYHTRVFNLVKRVSADNCENSNKYNSKGAPYLLNQNIKIVELDNKTCFYFDSGCKSEDPVVFSYKELRIMMNDDLEY